ncbi:AAA family ATPase [Microcoleus sp. LAD1_D5]|uniref:AAA family ATPase n=1 Tax=unclassified Microcoleus TaxID=2642155 RepID=UPI002FD6178D
MDWQEFLKGESGIHELSPEQTETLLSALLSPEKAPLNQAKLQVKLSTSDDNVKKRLGEIYKKFSNSFPELASQLGAGKLRTLHTKLKQKYYQPSQPVVATQASNSSPYPEEFKSLIKNNNKTFCGRRFVFEAFEQFISTNEKGYFVLVGYAGMGKTSLAAKYVYDHPEVISYFFTRDYQNKPEQFLNCIRRQLIKRYNLGNSEEDNLPALLSKITNNNKFSGRLVIVVDDLDEVNQYTGGGQNILYLPKTLPDGVYFFLTRQPSNLKTNYYNLNKDYLTTDLGTPVYQFNLTDQRHMEFHYKDMNDYLLSYLNVQENQLNRKINHWMNNHNISRETIIKRIAKKSENNFRCLNYLIEDILNESYQEPSFNELTPALSRYYQTHWEAMEMQNYEDQSRQILLYILVYKNGCQIPIDKLHEIADEEECYIEGVLHDWLKYLRLKNKCGKDYYTIYHTNFIEFIQSQNIMKSNRPIFQTIKNRIDEYLRST